MTTHGQLSSIKVNKVGNPTGLPTLFDLSKKSYVLSHVYAAYLSFFLGLRVYVDK
ncbi:hypothetical protein FC72_GL001348 [Companilactobacillus tucceti DSM 20183]|uniref:Uncharacterized protein n=1 Tax=Companilactobacillus tucceti DSM 20183 TaxID=1423811 RepID=A0A0R1J1L3_9LACO|nr:hypothetical protein FC72_GL001348 [Companilactobacillus tucceti DSM 20183]